MNVGCIPKKLMHNAAILGEHLDDARDFGWSVTKGAHSWETLRNNVQDYISKLNFDYAVALRSAVARRASSRAVSRVDDRVARR